MREDGSADIKRTDEAILCERAGAGRTEKEKTGKTGKQHKEKRKYKRTEKRSACQIQEKIKTERKRWTTDMKWNIKATYADEET